MVHIFLQRELPFSSTFLSACCALYVLTYKLVTCNQSFCTETWQESEFEKWAIGQGRDAYYLHYTKLCIAEHLAFCWSCLCSQNSFSFCHNIVGQTYWRSLIQPTALVEWGPVCENSVFPYHWFLQVKTPGLALIWNFWLLSFILSILRSCFLLMAPQ